MGNGGPNNPHMPYRVCKTFEVESGHLLSKHPGLCRHPHGHTRRIELVLSADRLDSADMVCDFKALKLAMSSMVDQLDHSLAVNSDDPRAQAFLGERLVIFEGVDPTTEVMARWIYDHLARELAAGKVYVDGRGDRYMFPEPGTVRLERVRVTETTSSWAEYSRE